MPIFSLNSFSFYAPFLPFSFLLSAHAASCLAPARRRLPLASASTGRPAPARLRVRRQPPGSRWPPRAPRAPATSMRAADSRLRPCAP